MKTDAHTHDMRHRSPVRAISLVAIVVVLAVAACGGSTRPSSAQHASSGDVRIASYDFSESVLLAQMYAIALRTNGIRAQVVSNLGSREVVDPALIQGAVDVVPEYVGSALNFLTGASASTTDVKSSYAKLTKAFADRGVVTLNYASAQDGNGFAVTRKAATAHGWVRMSDLSESASSLVFGGPPECVERHLCMNGLRTTYGLRFRDFRAFGDQTVTAQALLTGEIDVGLLNTTSGSLADHRLQLLDDDRRLQPAENVVPVVNNAAATRVGPAMIGVLDAVSKRLDTRDLVAMNHAVDVDGRDPQVVATAWLRGVGLLTGSK
jgi:osmoprotectant transport system substrate-binding protein